MEGTKEGNSEQGDGNGGSEGASWYELPPCAFFFTAGVLSAFLPKDTLFAGEYTDPAAVALVVSNAVIFVVFISFVLVIRRIGLTPAVQWMISPGFGVLNPEV